MVTTDLAVTNGEGRTEKTDHTYRRVESLAPGYLMRLGP